jgi:hypothetical protein
MEFSFFGSRTVMDSLRIQISEKPNWMKMGFNDFRANLFAIVADRGTTHERAVARLFLLRAERGLNPERGEAAQDNMLACHGISHNE